MNMFQSKRSQSEIVTGIDVGSTSIRIAIGQVQREPGKRPEIQLIASAEVASEGINKGVVNSIEDTVSSITGALEIAERTVGFPLGHAWIGVSGTHIMSQESKGVIAVAKSDGEISADDVGRVVEAARTVAPPLNYEMLHIIPRQFTVDGQTGIKDPIGMTGIRLEVDTQIIHGLTTHVNNVSKAVYRTGIDIDDIVLSILAAGDVVTSPKQKDLGVAVINIGGSVTTLVVYEDGDIMHTATIPVGSEHITNDLAIGLRTSIDIAERVKLQYGYAHAEDVQKTDVIDLSEVGGDAGETISRKYISEIVQARLEEILEKIDEELMKVNRSGLLPAGAVFTGGGAKCDGLIPLAKEVLELPASLGYPMDMSSATDKINDLAFTTAIGLIKWGTGLQEVRTARRGNAQVKKTAESMRNFFQSLIP
jgi:cell division protein FtsA